MRAADRTDYIVQALREGGAMYEDGAKSFLAEHDADRHAELLAQVEQLRDLARSAAVIFRSVADRVDRQQQANPAMLRENAAALDKLAGKGTGDGTQPPAGEPTQPDSGDRVVAYRNSDRPGVLLCREHGEGWMGLTPLTSEDLPDGGVCTYGDPADPDDACGRDVLIAEGGDAR